METDAEIRERLSLADRDADELREMLTDWALDTYEYAAVSDELGSIEDGLEVERLVTDA